MRLDDKERIEEAHGLWELAVTRSAAMLDMLVRGALDEGDDTFSLSLSRPLMMALHAAVSDEQATLTNWRRVSREATEKRKR